MLLGTKIPLSSAMLLCALLTLLVGVASITCSLASEAGLQKRSGKAPHEPGSSSSAVKDKGKGKQIMVEEAPKYPPYDPKLEAYSSDDSYDAAMEIAIMRSLGQDVGPRRLHADDYDSDTQLYDVPQHKYDVLPPYRYFFKKQWNAFEKMDKAVTDVDHARQERRYNFYDLVLKALRFGTPSLINEVMQHYRNKIQVLKMQRGDLPMETRKRLARYAAHKIRLWKTHKPRPCDQPIEPDELLDDDLYADEYDSYDEMEEEELEDDMEVSEKPVVDKKGKGKAD